MWPSCEQDCRAGNLTPRPSGATREASLSYPPAFRKSKCQKIRFFDSVLYNPPFVGTIQRVRKQKRVNSRGITARPKGGDKHVVFEAACRSRSRQARTQAEQKTSSGLYISSGAQEKPQRGKVVAVGEGKRDKGERIPVDVKVGDDVFYGKFGGNEVKVDGEDFLLLRADDIYAIIEE